MISAILLANRHSVFSIYEDTQARTRVHEGSQVFASDERPQQTERKIQDDEAQVNGDRPQR